MKRLKNGFRTIKRLWKGFISLLSAGTMLPLALTTSHTTLSSMVNNWRDHALVTCDHIDEDVQTRESLAEILQRHGAIRGVVVKEPHAEGDFHLHAAVSGKLSYTTLCKDVRAELPEGAHLSVLFRHGPKEGSKQTLGPRWSFEGMVDYATQESNKKNAADGSLDSSPLFFPDGMDYAGVIEAHQEMKGEEQRLRHRTNFFEMLATHMQLPLLGDLDDPDSPVWLPPMFTIR